MTIDEATRLLGTLYSPGVSTTSTMFRLRCKLESWLAEQVPAETLDAGVGMMVETGVPCEFDHPHGDHPCGRRIGS